MSAFRVDLDINWGRLQNLSEEERKSCRSFAEYLLRITVQCRINGIIPLEKEVEIIEDPFLKLAYTMVTGVNPEIVSLTLGNYINSSVLSNQDYMQKILILQWAKMIQNDTTPKETWYALASYFGLPLLKEMEESYDDLLNTFSGQSQRLCKPSN